MLSCYSMYQSVCVSLSSWLDVLMCPQSEVYKKSVATSVLAINVPKPGYLSLGT